MADVIDFRPRPPPAPTPVVMSDLHVWNCGNCGCETFTLWSDGSINCSECARGTLGLKVIASRKHD